MWLTTGGVLLALQLYLTCAEYYLRDQTVGCDGTIGSGLRLDVCGVCGGKNNSCRIISGIFTKRTHKAAYEYITDFPVGASHINITEARNTRNYLALRYSDSSRNIINSNWSLDWSGDYDVAGTTIQYKKPRRGVIGENIYIKGPLRERIQLLLLVQTRNPGIYYKYALPVKRSGVGIASVGGIGSVSAVARNGYPNKQNLPTYLGDALGSSNQRSRQSSYRWKVVDSETCSRSCGEGFTEGKVVCILVSSQVTVTEENCLKSPKPEYSRSRCNAQPCRPAWESEEWSVCSATCGRSTQTRQVKCRRRLSSTRTVSVSASNCRSSKKPSTVNMCQSKDCYTWSKTDWSECSVRCGAGKRTRNVNCVGPLDNKVVEKLCTLDKPRQVEKCYASCERSWFHGEWSDKCAKDCGGGNQTRRVYCPADRNSFLSTSLCGPQPQTTQACERKPGCADVGRWFSGEWSQCTGSCKEAHQMRDVICMVKRGAQMVVTDDRLCSSERKLHNKRKCRPLECDRSASDWLVTSWSSCSVTCGNGYQRRQVKCVNADQQEDGGCPLSSKPAIAKSCSKAACPQIKPTAAVDPRCRDKYTSCLIVVQARLCRLTYYRRVCCASCKHAAG